MQPSKKKKIGLHILFSAFFLLCIVAIFVVPKIVDTIQRDTQSFDQTMYCVEILEDGTVSTMQPIVLCGEMFNNPQNKRCIRLEEFTVDQLTFSTIYYHENQPTLNTLYTEFHWARICMVKNKKITSPGAQFFLSHDLQNVLIIADGRYFIASTQENMDPQAIRDFFLKDIHFG